jgi:hypothetical protein
MRITRPTIATKVSILLPGSLSGGSNEKGDPNPDVVFANTLPKELVPNALLAEDTLFPKL